MDVQGSGNNNEQPDSQSKTNDAHPSPPNIIQPLKKTYVTPKIWMEFDDFCSCFTSVIVYHNPRGYQYNHKRPEMKVREREMNRNAPLILKIFDCNGHLSFSFLHHNR